MNTNTRSNAREFLTSTTEMKRRKIAFISLEASLFISICISLYDVIISELVIAIPVMIFFAIILALLAIRFNKVHDSQSCYRVYLSDSVLERDIKDSSDKYLLTNIKSIRIKKTCKGIIREIKFGLVGEEDFYINGISKEDFELFKNEIIKKNKEIQVKTVKEPPIDFDHPFFYPILGIILGVASSFLLRFLVSANENIRTCVKNAVACYIIALGLFFILNKPTKRRYGNKDKLIMKDIIFGALLIMIGICFIVFL